MKTSDKAATGQSATDPRDIPRQGWWSILKRTWAEADRDNVSVAAAGVAFLGLLALFPTMVAITALYGLVADPAAITDHVAPFAELMPPAGQDLLLGQLRSLTSQQSSSLGWGLLISLGVALWSAGGGIRALMRSLNMAYGEAEKRSFFVFALTALVLTLCMMALMLAVLALVVIVPAVLAFLGVEDGVQWLVRVLRWPLLAFAVTLGLSILYRFGPCRSDAKWRWVTPGATIATGLWLLGSIAFSVYISNFADYNATYGSLGAGMALLIWLYLGAYAALLGAELDAEMERQTARDTTTGPEQPMGRRGAYVADTVAPR